MNTTLLTITIIVVLLFILLEIDHFFTVRRMNKQLRRSQERFNSMRSDLDGLKNDLIELDRINNQLEGTENGTIIG